MFWKARAVDDWKRKNVEGVAVEGEPVVSEADAALMLQHRRVETQYGREVVEEAVEVSPSLLYYTELCTANSCVHTTTAGDRSRADEEHSPHLGRSLRQGYQADRI